MKYYKDQQKDWVGQQKQELEDKNNREKYEEDLYAQQTLEATRMRQMLEENQKQKKQSIQNTMKEENQLLVRIICRDKGINSVLGSTKEGKRRERKG